MKIVSNKSKEEQKNEEEIRQKRLNAEKHRDKILQQFRDGEAYKLIIGIIDDEINISRDVTQLPQDATNYEEIGKLALIQTAVVKRLERLKSRL